MTFKVQIPAMLDKAEWKLLGQQLTITLPITDPLSYIKSVKYDIQCILMIHAMALPYIIVIVHICFQ